MTSNNLCCDHAGFISANAAAEKLQEMQNRRKSITLQYQAKTVGVHFRAKVTFLCSFSEAKIQWLKSCTT